jgi:hypothetical protein
MADKGVEEEVTFLVVGNLGRSVSTRITHTEELRVLAVAIRQHDVEERVQVSADVAHVRLLIIQVLSAGEGDDRRGVSDTSSRYGLRRRSCSSSDTAAIVVVVVIVAATAAAAVVIVVATVVVVIVVVVAAATATTLVLVGVGRWRWRVRIRSSWRGGRWRRGG